MNAMENTASLLLDAQVMGAMFQRELAGYEQMLVRSCQIHQTRRRISRKTEELGAPYLGVVYALDLQQRDSGALLPQWLYAKAYTRAASAAELPRALASAQAKPGVGLPLSHLAGLDTLVWALPNDPAMPRLAQFLDADAVRPHLPPYRHQQPDGWVRGCAHGLAQDRPLPAVQIVRYEPEEHCTARYAFEVQGQQRACYGKTYADASWQDVERRLCALFRLSQGDAGAFAIAHPLGSSHTLQAVWQEELPGVPLREALSGHDGERWIRCVAQALVRLHAMAPFGDAWLTPHPLLERARKQRNKLVRADASLAPALDPVLDALQQDAPAGTARVPIHGDFHVDQMHCSDGRIALFDYDNFAEGSPAHDVADFISHLLLDAAFKPERALALAQRFVACYRAQASEPLKLPELDWYLRLHYLRKAYSLFVRHRSGWRQRVMHACTLAASGLQSLTPQSMETTT